MRKINFKYLFILASLAALSCQRDDICSESIETTPLLIIRFYDIDEPEVLKAPQNLSIRSVDSDSTDFVVNTGGANPVTYFRYSQDSIAIPLKTKENETQYVFTLNTEADDNTATNTGLRDTISFTYGLEEEYINRACAYKISYVGLKEDISSGTNGASWIEDIQILELNVEDQNQAHVSIFF